LFFSGKEEINLLDKAFLKELVNELASACTLIFTQLLGYKILHHID